MIIKSDKTHSVNIESEGECLIIQTQMNSFCNHLIVLFSSFLIDKLDPETWG